MPIQIWTLNGKTVEDQQPSMISIHGPAFQSQTFTGRNVSICPEDHCCWFLLFYYLVMTLLISCSSGLPFRVANA